MKLLKSTILIAIVFIVNTYAKTPPVDSHSEVFKAKEIHQVLTQCEQNKNELKKIQRAQSAMKEEGSNKTLFDLQKDHDSITADLILLRGLKSLHTDYEKFRAEMNNYQSDFYSSDFKKMKESTRRNLRSVKRLASLNYLLDDLLVTDKDFRAKVASEDFKGDFFEYLESKCSGDESNKLSACNIVFNDDALTNTTLRNTARKTVDISSSIFMSAAREDAKKMFNGFYNAYAMSQAGKSKEEKESTIKSFRTVLLTGSKYSNPGKTLDKTIKTKKKEVFESLTRAKKMAIAVDSIKLSETDKSFKETAKGFANFRKCLVNSMHDVNLSCSPSNNSKIKKLEKEILDTHNFAAESFKLKHEDIETLENFNKMGAKAKKQNSDSQKRIVTKMTNSLKNLTNKNFKLSKLLGKSATNFNSDLTKRSFEALSKICQGHAKGLFSGTSTKLTVNNTKLKNCLTEISKTPDRINNRIKELEDRGNGIYEKMAKIKKQKPYENLQTIKRYATTNALKNCTGDYERVTVVKSSCGSEINPANPISKQLVDSSNQLIAEVDFFLGDKRREFESDLQSVKDACRESAEGVDSEAHTSNGSHFKRSCDNATEDLQVIKHGTKNQQMRKYLKSKTRRWDGHKWITKKRRSTSEMLGSSLLTSGIGLVGPIIQYNTSGQSIEAMKNQAMYNKQYMYTQNQWYDWNMTNWSNINTGGYTGWGSTPSSYYWGSTGTFHGGYPTYYQPTTATTTTTPSTTTGGFQW